MTSKKHRRSQKTTAGWHPRDIWDQLVLQVLVLTADAKTWSPPTNIEKLIESLDFCNEGAKSLQSGSSPLLLLHQQFAVLINTSVLGFFDVSNEETLRSNTKTSPPASSVVSWRSTHCNLETICKIYQRKRKKQVGANRSASLGNWCEKSVLGFGLEWILGSSLLRKTMESQRLQKSQDSHDGPCRQNSCPSEVPVSTDAFWKVTWQKDTKKKIHLESFSLILEDDLLHVCKAKLSTVTGRKTKNKGQRRIRSWRAVPSNLLEARLQEVLHLESSVASVVWWQWQPGYLLPGVVVYHSGWHQAIYNYLELWQTIGAVRLRLNKGIQLPLARLQHRQNPTSAGIRFLCHGQVLSSDVQSIPLNGLTSVKQLSGLHIEGR